MHDKGLTVVSLGISTLTQSKGSFCAAKVFFREIVELVTRTTLKGVFSGNFLSTITGRYFPLFLAPRIARKISDVYTPFKRICNGD